MAEKALPPVSKELLDYLERVFPDKCPDLDVSLDEVRYKAGQVHVVKHLKAILEKRLTNALR